MERLVCCVVFSNYLFSSNIVTSNALFSNTLDFMFQLEIAEGCRVPVKLKNTGEWRKFVALSGGFV